MKEEIKDEIKETVAVEKVETIKTETAEVINNGGKGFSIASLVLGIVSVVFCYNWFVTIVCGALAIIFGINGKQKNGKGMAKAGIILGIVGISLWLFVVVLAGFLIGLGTAAILSI